MPKSHLLALVIAPTAVEAEAITMTKSLFMFWMLLMPQPRTWLHFTEGSGWCCETWFSLLERPNAQRDRRLEISPTRRPWARCRWSGRTHPRLLWCRWLSWRASERWCRHHESRYEAVLRQLSAAWAGVQYSWSARNLQSQSLSGRTQRSSDQPLLMLETLQWR